MAGASVLPQPSLPSPAREVPGWIRQQSLGPALWEVSGRSDPCPPEPIIAMPNNGDRGTRAAPQRHLRVREYRMGWQRNHSLPNRLGHPRPRPDPAAPDRQIPDGPHGDAVVSSGLYKTRVTTGRRLEKSITVATPGPALMRQCPCWILPVLRGQGLPDSGSPYLGSCSSTAFADGSVPYARPFRRRPRGIFDRAHFVKPRLMFGLLCGGRVRFW